MKNQSLSINNKKDYFRKIYNNSSTTREYSKELEVGRECFKKLLRGLFSNKPDVYLYLNMDLSYLIDTLELRNVSIYNKETVNEVYCYYINKYLNILKGFLNYSLELSPQEYLLNCFINDHICRICYGGYSGVNLFSLNRYSALYIELDNYYNNQLLKAKDMFNNNKLSIKRSLKFEEANYYDMWFDITLLLNYMQTSVFDKCATKIENINKVFISSMRRDRLD